MLKKIKSIKDIKSSVSFVKNSYSIGTVVVVVAIVILFNLILQQMVGNSLQIDISESNIYEISDISTELLENLEDDIEFVVLGQEEYIDERIINFMERYTSLSNHITVEWIDPILHPTALQTYNASSDSIVISCEATGKSTVVALADILYMDEMAYYYYGTESTEFDGDGLFTSAISQVTSTNEYKIYQVTGHGEGSFSTTILDLMEKNSVTVGELNLLTVSAIPEDCELLTIYGISSDITADEKVVLEEYMSEGGNLLVMLGGTDVEMPNLEALLADYGLDVAPGYIADIDRAYQGNAYYMIPDITVSGDMATDMKTNSILYINTRGFSETEVARSTISLSSFITTSTNGISVTEEAEVYGTYILGAVATETIEATDSTDEVVSRLTVYGGVNIIDEGVTSTFTSLENTTLFMNSVMANFEGATNISIEPKVIEEPYNIIENPNGYSALFIFIIPLVVLIPGFVVWNGRRKQ